jgi:hypothetical protein
MKIEFIETKDVQARLMQAFPAIKDEMTNIRRAEQTAETQAQRANKTSHQLNLKRSQPLEFYETLETDIVRVYQISDIRPEDVPTLLLAQVQGMRNIRPIALLVAVPEEGFSVSEDTMRRIGNAANLFLKMPSRGHGMEVYMAIYTQRAAETYLQKTVFI